MKGHDYVFVVVFSFNKMCILIPCKNTINLQEVANKFFEQLWVHFGILRSIISYRNTRFLNAFWNTLWENMDTNLNRFTKFHPQTWEDISSQEDFGANFDELQSEASKDSG
jgi:hypothetical protein